ncbi:MAG: 3-deoxy-manno-octulosonate cytidylyltransferase [Legionellales bacterium]|jgi:3-deoxy-manno-octulosonate cytidylyltransferase (CMP-KDO synthetase)
MLKILCVIPARIGSTRLPRKPLALLAGKPMVQRTYEAAKTCPAFTEVVVATDSEEIATIIKNCGGTVVMTDASIETGSDRVAFVARQYKDMDIIVNLQGDEPFVIEPMLTALIQPYLNGERPGMTTLANPLDFDGQYQSPDFVKVIIDQFDNALYFSRAPIPYQREIIEDIPVYHHQGMYAFTRDFLLKFTGLSQTPLELSEKLEQLRALEHGFKIRVCLTPHKTLEINTPEELEQAQALAQTYWSN